MTNITTEQNGLFTPRKVKAPRRKSSKAEENIQIAFCKYVKVRHPEVIFFCDLTSGMKLPMHVAARNKIMRSSRGMPDFCAMFRGKVMFLELKKEKAEVYNQNGTFRKKEIIVKKGSIVIEKYDHVQEQEAMLKRFRSMGFYAEFGLGLDDCIMHIDKWVKKVVEWK